MARPSPIKRVVLAKSIVTLNGVQYDADVVRETQSRSRPGMMHWQQSIVDETRADITELAKPYADEDRFICSDTDSIMVIPREEDFDKFPTRKEHGQDAPYGTFLATPHTHIRDIKPRSYRSDQKWKQPGLSLASRSILLDASVTVDTPPSSGDIQHVEKAQNVDYGSHSHKRRKDLPYPHNDEDESYSGSVT